MTQRFSQSPMSDCECVCVCVRTDEGDVYVWDVRSRRCVNTFTDDGCIRGTSIAASLNGRYLACG